MRLSRVLDCFALSIHPTIWRRSDGVTALNAANARGVPASSAARSGGTDSLAWFAIQQHRHFNSGTRVDLQLSPNLAVQMESIVPAAPRHERIFERQPVDPTVHRNMFRIPAGLFLAPL